MRFSRLDLLKYGHFDGCPLEFPERDIDMHIIFGPNEAGKSTAMSAIADLLFKFPSTTPFDFRHDRLLLRVEATLTRDDSTITCRRKKGRSNTLLDANEEPIDEGILGALLGGQSRESFLRMFSLDHSRLRDGGHAILQAEDDIGQAIFAAGSGLVGITKLQETLDQEAKDIWGKRSASQSYHVAAKEYESAKEQQKKALIKPAAWVQLRNQVDEIRKDLSQLKEGRKKIEAERDKLELRRRTLGPIAKLNASRVELKDLGSISELPQDASSVLSNALAAVATAELQRSQEIDRKAGYEQQKNSIVIEGNLLSQRAEIESLQGSKGGVDSGLADLPKRKGELQTAVASLQRLQDELGWPSEDADATQNRIPKQIEISQVRGLLESRSGLDGKLSVATERQERASASLAQAREDVEKLASETDIATLSAALAVAQAAGDLDVTVTSASRLVEREQKELDRQIGQLSPWKGGVGDLETLSLPSEVYVGELSSRWKRDSDETSKERYALQKSEERLAQIELQEQQAAKVAGAISLEQITEVRSSRDATLTSIRDRVLAGSLKSEDSKDVDILSGQMRSADDVSDQRFAGAAQSSTLATKMQEKELASLEVENHRAEVDRLVAAEEATEREWRRSLDGLGFYLAPNEFAVWRGKRDAALQSAARVSAAKDQFDDEQTKRSETIALLRREIEKIRPDQTPDEITSYSVILQLALGLKQSVETAAKEHLRLNTVLKSASAEASSAASGKQTAQDNLAAWSTQWAPAVTVLGLSPDASVDVIRTQLGLIEELRTLVKEILSLEHRVSSMEGNVSRFKESVQALVTSCNLQTKETDDVRLMQELVRRSAEAATLADRKEALEKLIQESTDKIATHDEQKALADARISPLLEIANANDHEGLRKEIERCERARQVTDEIREQERELVGLGEGLSIDALLEAAEGTDGSSLRERSEELKEQAEQLLAQIEQKSADLKESELAFNAMDDAPKAVVAAADIEIARSSMSEEAERYLLKRCQALLLSWAVERYRSEKQAPLLKRASTLFAMLTLNRFNKLIVSTEEDEARLSGITADGNVVSVNGMSEGTVDQLFLALRIAAVEDEVAQGNRLPFLADDLFVNYDDHRAAAGFKVLSELAKCTQVLFFTHHQHLVSIAKAAVAPAAISECVLQA